MRIDNKEIVYTYIPPKQDWIDNKPTYSFELYSLLYSVECMRNNFKTKGFTLYSTEEICGFMEGKGYFDRLVVVTQGDEYIRNQDGGFNHPNMLYKMFTVEDITGPFLHMDNDLFINNPSTFNDIHNDVLFAYEERVVDHQLNEQYYNFYFTTYNEIIKSLDNEEIKPIEQFNPISAFNCCIFGGDKFETIKRSFELSNNFFKDNFEKLNLIPNMPGFIEQYLQVSNLLKEVPFVFISFLGDKINQPTDTPHYGTVTQTKRMDKYTPLNEYVNIDKGIVHDIIDYLKSDKNTHLSYIRWHPHYMIAIYNLLKEINPNIVTEIENIYGKHAWCLDLNEEIS